MSPLPPSPRSASVAAAFAAAAVLLLSLAAAGDAASVRTASEQAKHAPLMDVPSSPRVEEVDGPSWLERTLADPGQRWDPVTSQDADLMIVNADPEEQELKSLQQQKRMSGMMRAGGDNMDDNAFLEALLNGWPIYIRVPESESPLESGLRPSMSKRGLRGRLWKNKRANKLLRLSLTNNIDVLREKLFMEIARRNRLLNQNQVNQASTGLDRIG